MSSERLGLANEGPFRLGDRLVTPDANEIDGARIDPKLMDVLVALVEGAPAVMSAQVLLDRVWPDVVVVPNVVYQAIAQLRKALGDEPHAPRYIETIPRRGYRVVADVERAAPLVQTVARPPIIVAVLPLSDRTAERNMGYLCEGLAEDLMNALFPIEGLRVLSATDTFAFKDSQRGTREVGTSLGATVVLEGSVQRAGDRIAVAVRLVNIGDGVTIYSERFQRDAEDVFEVQSQIAARVVEGLQKKLGLAATLGRIAEARPRDPTAFVMFKTTLDPSDFAASVAQGELINFRLAATLECAIALDPSLDRAYADLIRLYLDSSIVNPAAHAKANALLAQLQSHEPNSPLIWQVSAELESDMARLATQCHSMITRREQIYPYAHPTGLRDVRGVYGTALIHAGLHREGGAYLKLVNRPDEPRHWYDLIHACGALVACREYDHAIAMCRRMQALSPNTLGVVVTWQVIAHVAMGDLASARSVSPDIQVWRDAFTLPMLQAKETGAPIESASADSGTFAKELRGYALLAMDDVERGIEHLLGGIAEAGPDLHWIGHRLPTFSVLFSDRVKRHPDYRRALVMARLDDASREPIRAQAATLTPITGVEVGPLLPL